MTTTDSTLEACFLCHRPLGEVALRYINGELFCEEDTANLATYGLIGAACKRQMELALHAMSHRDVNVDGLFDELTKLFEKYELISSPR